MGKVSGTLVITLKSDLCASSGEGFSSGIDVDTCYDEQGYPVILARRIKGCLHEAARLVRLDEKTTDAIFGTLGASEEGCLVVRDAVVDHDEGASASDADDILGRYTYVRPQTAIDSDSGSAKKNTLRFYRVVKHYVSRDDGDFEELSFRVRVSVEERYASDLERLAGGLRNLGLGRNRGFGAIRCRVEFDPADRDDDKPAAALVKTAFKEDGRTMVALSYVVRLESSVMLPRTRGSESADFIPGASVRGFFASKLKGDGRFEELFLRGSVRFSPLYPIDGVGSRSLPAPSFLMKVKGGENDGTCRNALTYVCGPGETPKPLRSGFVDSEWQQISPTMQTVYHHSHVGDGTLYTQRCLSKGQLMGGFIECAEEYAQDFERVLDGQRLAFGRSKGAQYASCHLVENERDFSLRMSTVTLREGRYALVFDSDALISTGEGAGFTTSVDSLVSAAKDAAERTGADSSWLDQVDVLGEGANDLGIALGTSIRVTTIAGYNAKWNQKLPHERAVAAGSCLVVQVPPTLEGVVINKVYMVGERQAEGYGRLIVVPLCDVNPSATEGKHVRAQRPATSDELARQRSVGLARSMHDKLAALTPAFVSRLSLMVTESRDAHDLNCRLKTIKDRTKRESALYIVQSWEDAAGDCDWAIQRECLQLVFTLAKYFTKQVKASEEGIS